MPALTFDESSHTYFFDGAIVPSVTQVLQAGGVIDTSHYTEHARTRGTAVHSAIELSLASDLDESSIDPEIERYLDAWKLFRSLSGFKLFGCEQMIYHPHYRYAGRFDLYGALSGKTALIDVKTGSKPAWAGIQLAAYKEAAMVQNLVNPYCRRLVLTLKANGKFALDECKDPFDFSKFLAALKKMKEAADGRQETGQA